MKKILIMGAFLLGAASVFAQQKPNYELASHFSAKKVNSMVFSTKVSPNPFEKSDRFWYEWQSTEGTSWYIVDPVKKTQTPVFDLDRLARQITEIIGDPFAPRNPYCMKIDTLKEPPVFQHSPSRSRA